jgi:uncharacterized membrane protein YdjX (TVP38/TMEM64 family)
MNRMVRWSLLAVFTLLLILVPFALWEEPLLVWSERLLDAAASGWIAFVAVVLLLVVDVVLPIPSSLVAAFAVSTLGAVAGGSAVWLGLTTAAWFGYGLGRWGGFPLARRVAGAAELERASQLMARHGAWILLAFRGVPVLAEASTLFAGAARHPPGRFALVVALANLGLSCTYALIALFELSGFALVWVPFTFGVAVPGMALVLLRGLGSHPQRT